MTRFIPAPVWLVLLGLFSSPANAQTPVNCDDAVAVSYSGYVFNRRTQTFDTVATIRNVSESALRAPISLVITRVKPAGVTLANAVGVPAVNSQMVSVLTGASVLASGQRVTTVLRFRSPTMSAFTFGASVLAVRDAPRPPTAITALAPLEGPTGSIVEVTGTGFTPTSRVTFGNVPAPTIYLSATRLATYVPHATIDGALTPLAAQELNVAVDGGPGTAFVVTATPQNPEPPGVVLPAAFTGILNDFLASEPEVRRLLAEASAETQSALLKEYLNRLGGTIAPAQAILAELPSLLTALPPDALTLLERAILAQQATQANADGGNTQQLAAGQQMQVAAVLHGDVWLDQRLSIVQEQKTFGIVAASVESICTALQAVPQAKAPCTAFDLAFSVVLATHNLRLARYGQIVSMLITAPRRQVADTDELRVETYPSDPYPLSAFIHTQTQINALDWWKVAVKVSYAVFGMTVLDQIDIPPLVQKEFDDLGEALGWLDKFADAIGVDGNNAVGEVMPRDVSFVRLGLSPNKLFDAGCVIFAQGLVSPAGAVQTATPLVKEWSCPYAVQRHWIVNQEEDKKVAIRLFTPSLRVDVTMLDFDAAQGGRRPEPRSFVVTSITTTDFGLPLEPAVEWNTTVENDTLAADRVLLSHTTGTIADGVVNVLVNTDALRAGQYSARIHIDSPDLHESPQTIEVNVTIRALLLSISPVEPEVLLGRELPLVARLENENGEEVLGDFEWRSDDTSIATVTAAGVVNGITEGETGVTVTDRASGAGETVTLKVVTAEPRVTGLGELRLGGNWVLTLDSVEDNDRIWINLDGNGPSQWPRILAPDGGFDNDPNFVLDIQFEDKVAYIVFTEDGLLEPRPLTVWPQPDGTFLVDLADPDNPDELEMTMRLRPVPDP